MFVRIAVISLLLVFAPASARDPASSKLFLDPAARTPPTPQASPDFGRPAAMFAEWFSKQILTKPAFSIAFGQCRAVFSLYEDHVLQRFDAAAWPAPGSEDTKLRCLVEQEADHGEKAVYAGVQA
jgi:hypothetical protein